ncbi:hypothetical protein BC833DRAFT_611379 [Globomyces pollinis-pini]|nr:hypothetical protein BC833DRAFT_611379 [Globomyces pollinis-pini]
MIFKNVFVTILGLPFIQALTTGSAPNDALDLSSIEKIGFYGYAAIQSKNGRVFKTNGGTRYYCYNVRLDVGDAMDSVVQLSANTGVYFHFKRNCSPNSQLGDSPPQYQVGPVSDLVKQYGDRVQSFELVHI